MAHGWLEPWRSRPFTVGSPLPPARAAARLATGRHGLSVTGLRVVAHQASPLRVRLVLKDGLRRARWSPVLRARLAPAGAGSRLEGSLRPALGTRALAGLWLGVLLAGAAATAWAVTTGRLGAVHGSIVAGLVLLVAGLSAAWLRDAARAGARRGDLLRDWVETRLAAAEPDDAGDAADAGRAGFPVPRWAPGLVLFVVFVPLAYSDILVDAVVYASGVKRHPETAVQLAVLALDVVLLLGTAALVRWLWRPVWAVRWRWFWAGALLSLALDEFLAAMPGDERLDGRPGWQSVALVGGTSIAYAVALAGIVAGVLGFAFDRADAAAWRRFRPTVPLLIGVCAGYVGSGVWDPLLEVAGEAQSTIDPEYFAQISQIIPLLLIALGLDAALFRRLRGQAERAVVIVTVVVLCLAEALAIGVLAVADDRANDKTSWHEYLAFVATLQAAWLALSMLAWELTRRRPPSRVRR